MGFSALTLFIINKTLFPTSAMSLTSSVVQENSMQNSIKSSLPSKIQSPTTPSVSASGMPEMATTNGIVLVLIAAIAVLLLLLILDFYRLLHRKMQYQNL